MSAGRLSRGYASATRRHGRRFGWPGSHRRAYVSPHGSAARTRNRPRRWGGQATDAADLAPSQARRPVRWHLPADRLRPVEHHQLGVPQGGRAHPVQVAQPGQARHEDVADVQPPRQLRDARARRSSGSASTGTWAAPTRSTSASTSSTTSAPTSSWWSAPTTSTGWTSPRWWSPTSTPVRSSRSRRSASRSRWPTEFGVIETTANDPRKIAAFREKPSDPVGLADSPGEILASMGNYVANADALVRAVTEDAENAGLQARHGRRPRARTSSPRAPPASTTSSTTTSRARPTATATTGATSGPWTPTSRRTRTSSPSTRCSTSTTTSGRCTRGTPVCRRRSSSTPDRTGSATRPTPSSPRASSCPAPPCPAPCSPPGSYLHSWAAVSDSVLMDGVKVHRHAQVHRAILDKNVIVADARTDRARPRARPRARVHGDRERDHRRAEGLHRRAVRRARPRPGAPAPGRRAVVSPWTTHGRPAARRYPACVTTDRGRRAPCARHRRRRPSSRPDRRSDRRLVVMDVDSTLITGEVIEMLAARAGAGGRRRHPRDRAGDARRDRLRDVAARAGRASWPGCPSGCSPTSVDEVRLTPGAASCSPSSPAAAGRWAWSPAGSPRSSSRSPRRSASGTPSANRLEVADGRLTGRVTGPGGRPGRQGGRAAPASPRPRASRWTGASRSATARTTST